MSDLCRDCVNRFICERWSKEDGRTLCVNGSCYEKDEEVPEGCFDDMA